MLSYIKYAPAILIPRLITMFVTVVFSRFLDPEQIGLYALIILYGEYLDTILIQWTRTGYSRFYKPMQVEGRSIERMTLALMAPGFLLAGIFSAIYPLFNSLVDAHWASLLLLYVLANSTLYLGLQFLRVRHRSTIYSALECGRSLFGFLIAYALVKLIEPSYAWLVLGTQSTTAVAAAILLVWMIRADRGGKFDASIVVRIWKYSAPLILAFLLTGTLRSIDRFLVERILGTAILGIYAVGYQISRPPMDVLFNVINTAGFPKLVEAYETKGDAGAIDTLHENMLFMNAFAIPAMAVGLSSSYWLASLVLHGPYVQPAAFLMPWFVIASYLRGIARFVYDQVFYLKKNTSATFWNQIPPLAVILALAPIVMPRYGLYGAAVVTMVGSIIDFLMSYVRANRILRVNLFMNETKIIFAISAVIAIALYLSGQAFGLWGWLAATLVLGGLYLLLLWKTKMFKKLGILGL